MSKPIIAVCGATGQQGGSVAKFLLRDGGFKVRALTRNVESPNAKELSEKGAEVIEADFNDPNSVKKAFEGAFGVFGVTNYFDSNGRADAEGEIRHGRTLVDAAKAENIQHFVWSGGDHTTDPVVGNMNCKAAVNDHLISSGVPRTSTLPNSGPFKKAANGSYEAKFVNLASDGPIIAFPVSDLGGWVLQAFKKPEVWLSKEMRIVTEVYTPRDLIKIISEEAGVEIKLQETSFEDFEKFKDISYDLWATMKYIYNYDGVAPGFDVATSRHLYPEFMPIRQWVKENLQVLLPA